MAKYSLRAYYQEIESLIENKRNDEAIAHCRHILQTYPRCIDAYRLLGKALLENQHYGDATDIFQRVLSAVPDDTISHAGLSVVREDEGNLDEAIWHMERAYEVQPSNPAIQTELRRLYSRRDGSEPLKIRLSRGALARMYVRGELFPQAIADIRAALAEDPNLVDLQILLADIYHKTGKTADAVDQAYLVLQKNPHSYEANRLLALLLSGSERDADAKACLQRVIELNPYVAHLASLADPIEQADDQAVMLDKLEWSPEQASEKSGEKNVEHMLETQDEGLAAPGDEEIPEWLQDAGWAAGAIAANQPELEISEPEAAELEEPVKADLPEWLKEFSPADEVQDTAPVETPEGSESEEDMLPWLDKLFSTEVEQNALDLEAPELDVAPAIDQPVWMIEESEQEEPGVDFLAEKVDDIPDWLADSEKEAEIPDWMTGSEKEAEEEVEMTAEIPDWLTRSEPEHEEIVPTDAAVEPALEAETEAEMAAEIPDWLITPAALTAEVEETLAEMADDTPDWLSSEEINVGDEGELASETPDWLSQLEEPEISVEDTRPSFTTLSKLAAPAVEELGEGEIESELLAAEAETGALEPEEDLTGLELTSSKVLSSQDEEDAAFAWLETLAFNQGAEEALLLTPEERSDQAPEWVAESIETVESEVETLVEAIEEAEVLPSIEEADIVEAAAVVEEAAIEEEPAFEEEEAIVEEEAEPEALPEAEVEIPVEAIPDLPSWLEDAEPGAAEPLEWIPPAVRQFSPVELNHASLVELERLPGVGFRLAQQIIAFRDENGPFKQISDLYQIPGTEDLNQEELNQLLYLEVVPVGQSAEAPAALIDIVDTLAEPGNLNTARRALNQEDLDRAAEQYSELVQSGETLPDELQDILQDLQEAVKYHPQHFGLWQTLGDAYMRSDQVKQALEAYISAEKLLR